MRVCPHLLVLEPLQTRQYDLHISILDENRSDTSFNNTDTYLRNYHTPTGLQLTTTSFYRAKLSSYPS